MLAGGLFAAPEQHFVGDRIVEPHHLYCEIAPGHMQRVCPVRIAVRRNASATVLYLGYERVMVDLHRSGEIALREAASLTLSAQPLSRCRTQIRRTHLKTV